MDSSVGTGRRAGMEAAVTPDQYQLLMEALKAVQDRELTPGEASRLARHTAALLDKLIPHCAGARHGWIWRVAIHGARGCLLEAAEHLATQEEHPDA
jgi:hypothetical protein